VPSLAACVAYQRMSEKSNGGSMEGVSKNRKVMIQLLPLIVIIINIFYFQNYPLAILLFSQKQYMTLKVIFILV
jgi:hypothetical protein